MMTVAAWLLQAQNAIAEAQRAGHLAQELSAKREAEWLLMDALDKSRAWLLMAAHDELSPEQREIADAWLKRRCAGEPLAYLTGEQGFWSLSLAVNGKTLVPRPDTELLVETALRTLVQVTAPKVLDMGTGSGAIALAIAYELPHAEVWAVDRCHDALAVAHGNAERMDIVLKLLQSDWFSALDGQHFDLIVSNPPYLAPDDPYLPSLQFEPRHALVAAENGLADLCRIIESAGEYLNNGGWLWLEHGHTQAQAVREMLNRAGFLGVDTRCDLGGNQRVTGGCWHHAE